MKKKFQWTPYSVTCSYNTRARVVNHELLFLYVCEGFGDRPKWGRILTGYSTPLTMMTRTMPSAITGNDFLTVIQIVYRYESGESAEFGPFCRVETGEGLSELTVREGGGGGSERDWRRRGRAETRPREKTKEPTPRSICRADPEWRNECHLLVSTYSIRSKLFSLCRLTSEVPQVSAFANSRGKAGKSTARMHRTVMTIMMAR